MFISKINKELSKVEVPNFTGLTVSQPKEKAKSSNLELRIHNARQIMKSRSYISYNTCLFFIKNLILYFPFFICNYINIFFLII